ADRARAPPPRRRAPGPQPPVPEGPASSAPRAPDGPVPPSGPTPVPPGTPPVPPPSRPAPPPQGKSARVMRNFHIISRQGGEFPIKSYRSPNGETTYVVTGGVILRVGNAPGVGMVDMEADRVVNRTKDTSERRAANIQQ